MSMFTLRPKLGKVLEWPRQEEVLVVRLSGQDGSQGRECAWDAFWR